MLGMDCFAPLAMTGIYWRINNDLELPDREQRGASAAAGAGLQEHGEARAAEALDHPAAYAVGTDRTGLRPRDRTRGRQRSHHPAPGRAAWRAHHRARPCAR